MENTFGEYLRRERELREISLEEISQKTRIQKRFLQALEQDRLNLLPGLVFTKGFIRAYAEYLGLDVNQALLRFEEFLKNSQPETKQDKTKSKNLFRSPVLWSLCLGVGIIIIIGVYSLYQSLSQGVNKTQSIKSNEASDNTPKPAKEIPSQKLVSPLSPPFLVQFKANELCWVFATIDGKLSREVMLKPGELWEITAEQKLSLIIGNAGGVELTVNSQKLRKIGSHWKPTRLFIPEDLPKYLPEPQENPQPEPEK